MQRNLKLQKPLGGPFSVGFQWHLDDFWRFFLDFQRRRAVFVHGSSWCSRARQMASQLEREAVAPSQSRRRYEKRMSRASLTADQRPFEARSLDVDVVDLKV